MAFRIDQNAAAVFACPRHTFTQRCRFALAASASVDDDRAQFTQDAAYERKPLEMVAGHKGKILHFRIDHETVAPAGMLRGENERAVGQVLAAADLFPNPANPVQSQN